MFDPAESLATTIMISDFIRAREECYNPYKGEPGSVKKRIQRCRPRDAFKIPGDGVVKKADEEHLRRRREVARVEARKYIQLRMKCGGDEGLEFNPAAGERDRLRSLLERETASISGQRDHIERYANFGERFREMSREKGWRFNHLLEIAQSTLLLVAS